MHLVGSMYTDTSLAVDVRVLWTFLNMFYIYRRIDCFLLENLVKNGRTIFLILWINWMLRKKTLVDFFKNPYKYHGNRCNAWQSCWNHQIFWYICCTLFHENYFCLFCLFLFYLYLFIHSAAPIPFSLLLLGILTKWGRYSLLPVFFFTLKFNVTRTNVFRVL